MVTSGRHTEGCAQWRSLSLQGSINTNCCSGKGWHKMDIITPLSVYLTLPHVSRSPRPPLSMFACCKWSKSGGDVYTSTFIIPTVRSSKHLRSYSSQIRPLLLFLHTATNRRQYQLENGYGQCHCHNCCGLPIPSVVMCVDLLFAMVNFAVGGFVVVWFTTAHCMWLNWYWN